ncbi:MAG: hypothetical protein ACOCWQ_05510 [Nanoarchaeota archaeon]
MGHTVMSQRQVIDLTLSELQSFTKALDRTDRQLAERILKRPLAHIGSISNAASMHVWAFLLLTIILEQEKKIKYMEEQYAGMAD